MKMWRSMVLHISACGRIAVVCTKIGPVLKLRWVVVVKTSLCAVSQARSRSARAIVERLHFGFFDNVLHYNRRGDTPSRSLVRSPVILEAN